MPKIMVLSVSGTKEPFKRLVSVDDEDELLGTVTMEIVRDIVDDTSRLETVLSREGLVVEALSKLKVKLVDTGLKEYPETKKEVDEVLNGGVLC